jgi:hypothetical protein
VRYRWDHVGTGGMLKCYGACLANKGPWGGNLYDLETVMFTKPYHKIVSAFPTARRSREFLVAGGTKPIDLQLKDSQMTWHSLARLLPYNRSWLSGYLSYWAICLQRAKCCLRGGVTDNQNLSHTEGHLLGILHVNHVHTKTSCNQLQTTRSFLYPSLGFHFTMSQSPVSSHSVPSSLLNTVLYWSQILNSGVCRATQVPIPVVFAWEVYKGRWHDTWL